MISAPSSTHQSLFDALTAVVEIHLVALPVAEGRSRTGRITEGTVETGSIFYRIGHDRGGVVAVGIQHLTDGADTAVHHIGGRYHIGSCLHMGKGCFCQQLQRPVIVHVMTAEHAAVAVGGILAHAHIGDEIHLREIFSCLTKGFWTIPSGS